MADIDTTHSISIRRRIALCFKMLGIAWRLKKSALLTFFVGALLEIGGSISTIYAGARLAALLASYITTGRSADIWFWFWITLITGFVTGIGFLTMNYGKRLLYFRMIRWSTNTFMRALTEITLQGFYDDVTRNQINKVAGSYTWQLANLGEANLDLLYGLLRFLAITAVVSQITWWIVPLIALFLTPTLISDAKIAKLLWFVWDQKGDERHVYWGLEYVLRQARGQMEIRSIQANQYVLNKIDSMNRSFYTEQEERYKKARPSLTISQILENVGPGVAGVVVLRQFLHHAIGLEKYFFLTGALVRIGGALNTVFGTLTRLQEPLLLADSYFALVDEVPKVKDPINAIKLKSAKSPDIVFEDVTFSYPDQSTPVFEKLNLHIEPGEHVAIVGENGAGKSTLIKLLLKFYTPDSGRILINGLDLQTLSTASWYDQVATLFQNFNTYPFPIDENIQIGRTNKPRSQKQLLAAARFGGVDDLVKKYPHGWKTVLDSSFKKGIEPSGGQWQRVALARTFYRQAKILILDEPTSAIDARAEYSIFNSIFEHYKAKSTIIVSHRFSTVRRADRIIVLDQGKIIEQGSHQTLMKQAGLYYELFSKQAEGYRD